MTQIPGTYYPSYNYCAHFFSFENSLPIKARNITHKITPAVLTNLFSGNYFSLARNRVFFS